MPPVLTKATSNAEGEDLGSPLEVKDLKTADVVLYQFDASPPCWKIRALLHWYEIPYQSVTAYPGSKIDGLDNTYHKIPKLVIDGTQINDSAVVFRTLAPILTDAPLTESQTELEKRNNISGLLGALEKETVSSYFGIVSAARTLTNGWNSWSYMPLKPFLPYAAGFLAPLGLLAFRNMPHGKDGDSLEHGRAYRDALGKSAFFHGEQIGPLDLSLYGTFACFIKALGAPQAHAVLDKCDLRAWYERCDGAVSAIRPVDGGPPSPAATAALKEPLI